MAENEGIAAPQNINSGENDAVPVEKARIVLPDPHAIESSSDDEDGRRPAKSSSLKRTKVLHEITVNNSNGDKSSSTKIVDQSRSIRKFLGAHRRPSGRWSAEIKDPFNKRKVWLGTFDTPEEASNVYTKKRLEFLERKREAQSAMNPSSRLESEFGRSEDQIDTGKNTVKRLDLCVQKDAQSAINPSSRLESESAGSEEQIDTGKNTAKRLEFHDWNPNSSVRPESESDRSEEQVDTEKNLEPILTDSNKFLWSRLNKFDAGMNSKNIGAGKNSEPILIESSEFLLGEFRNLDNDLTALNKFPGAYRRKSGRWWAEIRDSFMKRKINLGTFDTRQEASNAYAAKKLEFRKRKEAQFAMNPSRLESESGRSEEQIDAGKNTEPILIDTNNEFLLGKFRSLDKGITSLNKFPGAHQQKSGRWSASIKDPFMKLQIKLGTFDTPQEASNAYAAKKLEFHKKKEAESYLPKSDSAGSGELIEAGQNWEQILIDSNGFLLGEFSNLDDDLRIS